MSQPAPATSAPAISAVAEGDGDAPPAVASGAIAEPAPATSVPATSAIAGGDAPSAVASGGNDEEERDALNPPKGSSDARDESSHEALEQAWARLADDTGDAHLEDGSGTQPEHLHVSGAGRAQVNGKYTITRLRFSGRPSWLGSGGHGFLIHWSTALEAWVIAGQDRAPIYRLQHEGDRGSSCPPLGACWDCAARGEGGGEGDLPAPTVTFVAPWVRDEVSKRTPRRIEKTAERGISVEQLLGLADIIQEAVDEHNIVENSPYSPDRGRRLDWKSLAMYAVCTYFVYPLTCTWQCSYVESLGEEKQPPTWMVSHWWGCSFAQTVKMLQFHASVRCFVQTSFWICTLANNQHNLEELQGDGIMETPFANVLLSLTCTGTVLLCDSGVTPLQRAWCIFEAYITDMARTQPETVPEEVMQKVRSKPIHYFDVATSTSASGKDCQEVALLLDTKSGLWEECTEDEDVQFPLEVSQRGIEADISTAKASVEIDRSRIMNYITGQPSSLEKPPEEHEQYTRLNGVINAMFASAELYRVCSDLLEGCEATVATLISLRADPNKFIRCTGDTALSVAVGDEDGGQAEDDESVEKRRVDLVGVLLKSGADPNVVWQAGHGVAAGSFKTPLMSARTPAMKKLLMKHGAKETTPEERFRMWSIPELQRLFEPWRLKERVSKAAMESDLQNVKTPALKRAHQDPGTLLSTRAGGSLTCVVRSYVMSQLQRQLGPEASSADLSWPLLQQGLDQLDEHEFLQATRDLQRMPMAEFAKILRKGAHKFPAGAGLANLDTDLLAQVQWVFPLLEGGDISGAARRALALKIRCVVARVRCEIEPPDLEPEGAPRQSGGEGDYVVHGEILRVLERRGIWVSTARGWLPMQLNGRRNFERLSGLCVTSPANPAVLSPTANPGLVRSLSNPALTRSQASNQPRRREVYDSHSARFFSSQ